VEFDWFSNFLGGNPRRHGTLLGNVTNFIATNVQSGELRKASLLPQSTKAREIGAKADIHITDNWCNVEVILPAGEKNGNGPLHAKARYAPAFWSLPFSHDEVTQSWSRASP
jgi:hypothetical protein